MNTKEHLLNLIPQQGFLPLFFYPDEAVALEVLRTLFHAGIRTVEYTNRGPMALSNFRAMRKLCDHELKGMYLGIGTIKSGAEARAFIDAGADYIVSPALIASVAETSDSFNTLWVPGCMTPTEILAAENLGATLIKIFPGNVLGPGFVSVVKDLFPRLIFMPTGGVEPSRESVAAWFKAGVSAVGIGNKLLSKAAMDARDYKSIELLARDLMATIATVRSA